MCCPHGSIALAGALAQAWSHHPLQPRWLQEPLIALLVSLTPSNPSFIYAARVIFLECKSKIFAPSPRTHQGCPKCKLPACFACNTLCDLASLSSCYQLPHPKMRPMLSHINTSNPLTISQSNKLTMKPCYFSCQKCLLLLYSPGKCVPSIQYPAQMSPLLKSFCGSYKVLAIFFCGLYGMLCLL